MLLCQPANFCVVCEQMQETSENLTIFALKLGKQAFAM